MPDEGDLELAVRIVFGQLEETSNIGSKKSRFEYTRELFRDMGFGPVDIKRGIETMIDRYRYKLSMLGYIQ